MSTPTGRAPQRGDLLSLVVGQPVSRSHGLRGVGDLSFLLGFAGAHPIVSTTPRTRQVQGTMPVIYARNPGVQVLLIEARLETNTAGAYCTLAVTASSGTVTWIAANGLDGSRNLTAYANDTLQDTVYQGVLDVSQLPASTPVELRFTTAAGSVTGIGISYLNVIEVPPAATDPVGSPTNERGLDAAWPSVNGRLIDGSATGSARGFRRWVAELDTARAGVKRHLQICAVDSTFGAWTEATGTLQTLPSLRMRARRLYTTSTPNRYTAIVAYRTSDGTTAGQVTVSDGTSTANLTLTASTSRTVATATFDVVTSGTDQLADITWTYQRTSGAGTVIVSNFCLLETES